MSGRRELLALDAARGMVLEGVAPLEAESTPLDEVRGRCLAGPAISPVDLPQFDNSSMDGYAVRAEDTSAATATDPVTLIVRDESRAGLPAGSNLGSGRAIAISTGATMPDGADAVIPVEDVESEDGAISVTRPVEAGRWIRFRGEVVKAGTEVLPDGSEVGPVEVGLLATIGQDPVRCVRRPRVALLVSGDELVQPGQPLEPGQIWNSNSFAVSVQIEEAGADLVAVETVPDGLEETVEALKGRLDADLIVICGGVSVGKHDHVKPALSQLGVEQLFWGLALKPGRPTWFGLRGNTRVIGLPGNPVSAFVVFQLLAVPLLRALAGGSPAPRQEGILAEPVDRLPHRLFAMPARLARGSGQFEVQQLPQIGSHDFLSLLGADCLALIPPGDGRIAAGESVETVRLAGN